MNTLIESIIEQVPFDTLTDEVLFRLLKGSSDSRYGRIKRAIACGDLIHIRRGLYTLAKKYQRRGINLYELAQQIYGPSYISFESALSYHGLIPEAVYTITSACVNRSKNFQTPLGLFSFTHLTETPFYLGVQRMESPHGTFFMAEPWKALVDYVIANKKDWVSLKPVIESLRVEEDQLREGDFVLLNQLAANIKNQRAKKFITGIKKELNQ